MKQGTKRLLSLVIALLFLAAAFTVFFNLVQPAYAEVQTLRGEAQGEANSLVAEQALVTQIQNLLASYNSQSANETSLSMAMPAGQNISGALTEVQGIAENSNMTITNVLVSPPALVAQQMPTSVASSSVASLVQQLGSFTIQLSATGSYEDLENFIAETETNIRLFDLESVTLSPSVPLSAGVKVVPARDVFNYTISLQAYYQLP